MHRKNNKKWDKETWEKKKNMKMTGMRSATAAAKEQACHDEVEEMVVGLEEALLCKEEKQSQVFASEAIMRLS
ncbi:hypothetical protein E1B28_009363 [Marasmius oreades]|uniref:Uncharacterized protein n=1 Tax=Marasmius oreades TaxID=181124 RepID=A0A9P7S1Z6_9AGAR|nr:uncharacterized protein E1B28_009363 [Marasmius oreades]KAG7093073.1 hypothetical protein E1B28_009363 [Marasmius oreades]